MITISLQIYIFKMELLCELNKLPALNSLRIQNNPFLKGMSVCNYTLQTVARIANLTVNYVLNVYYFDHCWR